MKQLNKKRILYDYINKKNNVCRNTNLLSEQEKINLKSIIDGKGFKNDFFVLINDEFAELKKRKTASSYLYTYKQAQALYFCCNHIGLNVDINVMFDEQELNNILKNHNSEIEILDRLGDLIIDYIEVKRRKEK